MMLLPRMLIHFQLAAMAPMGRHKGTEKATGSAKMPTSVIHRRLSLDRKRSQGFNLEHIRGLIRIHIVCGIKDETAWDLFYDIIFLDPVTTRHFSQYKLMWPHRRSRGSPFREWWAAFRSYMRQMFDKTRNQMNNWGWKYLRTFVDQVNPSNPQTTSSGKVTRAGEHFSSYGRDDFRAKIEPPSCWQYKPGDFLAVRPLNCDDIIDDNDDDENWVDSGAPGGGRSRPANGNDNDNGEGEKDTQGSEKGTGTGKET